MPHRPKALYDLNRFIDAQAANYDAALTELRAGRKCSHWSWYVLPQIQGLGSSAMSVRYALSGIAEAKAYLDHPILGARLRECVAAINAHDNLSATDILGEMDAKKFHSCVTLFSRMAEPDSPFHEALNNYFNGEEDAATNAILARQEKT